MYQQTNTSFFDISWLNLELGFDTCYFQEMDVYMKTWLQLVLPPPYVILLVVLVIIISSCSTKLSNLIGTIYGYTDFTSLL